MVAGDEIMNVSEDSQLSFSVANWYSGEGFIGTAKAEYTQARGKPISPPELFGVRADIEKRALHRSAMQPPLLMLYDYDDPEFLKLMHEDLADSYEGYKQWARFLGHEPTHEDVVHLLTDREQRKIWLKRRVVSLKDGEWKEQVVRPGTKVMIDGQEEDVIGMFVYYLGKFIYLP